MNWFIEVNMVVIYKVMNLHGIYIVSGRRSRLFTLNQQMDRPAYKLFLTPRLHQYDEG